MIEKSKQEYSAPRIVEYGDITEQTKGNPGDGGDPSGLVGSPA